MNPNEILFRSGNWVWEREKEKQREKRKGRNRILKQSLVTEIEGNKGENKERRGIVEGLEWEEWKEYRIRKIHWKVEFSSLLGKIKGIRLLRGHLTEHAWFLLDFCLLETGRRMLIFREEYRGKGILFSIIFEAFEKLLNFSNPSLSSKFSSTRVSSTYRYTKRQSLDHESN